MPSASQDRIDSFFILHAARADRWRAAADVADRWANGDGDRAAVKAALADVLIMEEFHAVPGAKIMRALDQRIEADDAAGTARAVRRISEVILVEADTANTLERASEGEGQDDHRLRAVGPGRRGAGPPVLRDALRHGAAGQSLAGAGRRDAPAAAQGGPVRLRAGLRRLVRGRVLRRHRQSAHRGGRDRPTTCPIARATTRRCCARILDPAQVPSTRERVRHRPRRAS